LAQTVASAENTTDSGVAPSPGGSVETPALGPGESVEFGFSAAPGDHFTMETMFVQSNDWFYGFEGLALFEGDEPVSGDVTDAIAVYDAGTEADTAPGTGPDQKPVQDPEAMDVGPKEDEPIQLAGERHPDFDIPDASEVIEVTITPQ
jgi:Spondin_N.